MCPGEEKKSTIWRFQIISLEKSSTFSFFSKKFERLKPPNYLSKKRDHFLHFCSENDFEAKKWKKKKARVCECVDTCVDTCACV